MPRSKSILLPPAHKTNRPKLDEAFTPRQMAALRMGREQHRRIAKHPHTRITTVIVDGRRVKYRPGCNLDSTGEYDCGKQPCIRCLGPWDRPI